MAVLRVEHVSKAFKKAVHYPTVYSLLEHRLLKRRKSEEHWVLQDVGFEVNQGEMIGLIGRNGSGKTTLLKIIAGLYRPSAGRVVADGHLVSLLQLGIGMERELSAIENIYMMGIVLGLPRASIKKRLDEVIEFSDINTSLDQPIKYFSMGMIQRLAFAIARLIPAEILILDEIWAASDILFKEKCLNYLKSYINDKHGTVIITSHEMGLIQNFCSKALLLDRGRQVAYGPTDQVLKQYENMK